MDGERFERVGAPATVVHHEETAKDVFERGRGRGKRERGGGGAANGQDETIREDTSLWPEPPHRVLRGQLQRAGEQGLGETSVQLDRVQITGTNPSRLSLLSSFSNN